MPLSERFMDKYLPCPASGCWLWIGAYDKNGYGLFNVGLKSPRGAHRVAWTLFVGPIPVGMHVLHSCDVKECVNPKHLFLGTHSDNMRDMAIKHRSHRPIGTKNRAAVLLEESVKKMRELYAASSNYAEIGRLFGVSAVTARRAITGITWGHIKS